MGFFWVFGLLGLYALVGAAGYAGATAAVGLALAEAGKLLLGGGAGPSG